MIVLYYFMMILGIEIHCVRYVMGDHMIHVQYHVCIVTIGNLGILAVVKTPLTL